MARKQITAAVYEHLADCGGKRDGFSYNSKDDAVEIFLLTERDTMVSHRFAMRAIEHIKTHCVNKLPDKIVLTFIAPEQKNPHIE